MKRTFVFAGPSAVGKTFIAEQLMRLYPGTFEQARLYTTRAPRTGENPTDRIFVTTDIFDEMADQGKFIVHDEFGGNNYGFDHDSLYPKDAHLLVNAWPWLVPHFSTLPHVVIIGMQAPADWQDMLVSRMEKRGDKPVTIEKRLQLIAKDYADLQKHEQVIAEHGRYFVIQNDETIVKEILPWLKTVL